MNGVEHDLAAQQKALFRAIESAIGDQVELRQGQEKQGEGQRGARHEARGG